MHSPRRLGRMRAAPYYYAYSFTTQHGKAVRVHTQKWADTAWNGDGQNKSDGNILGR